MISYVRQAATYIITILTNPPSTTAPSLQAGDPVQNALLQIAEKLQQAEPLPDLPPTPLTKITPSQRVKENAIPSPRVLKLAKGAPSPRVLRVKNNTLLPLPTQKLPSLPEKSSTTMSSLQQHSNKLKNQRYKISGRKNPISCFCC